MPADAAVIEVETEAFYEEPEEERAEGDDDESAASGTRSSADASLRRTESW